MSGLPVIAERRLSVEENNYGNRWFEQSKDSLEDSKITLDGSPVEERERERERNAVTRPRPTQRQTANGANKAPSMAVMRPTLVIATPPLLVVATYQEEHGQHRA